MICYIEYQESTVHFITSAKKYNEDNTIFWSSTIGEILTPMFTPTRESHKLVGIEPAAKSTEMDDAMS